MLTSDTPAPSPTAEQYERYTPFQDSYVFEGEESPLSDFEEPEVATAATPFLSEYAGAQPAESAEAVELQELLRELYDHQFEESLSELAQEAWSAAADRASEFGDTVAGGTAEQFLDEWSRPVRERAEEMLDGVAESAAQFDIASMGEAELDQFFERFEPRATGLEPHFENFLGGLLKKAKTLVKKVAAVASKGLAMVPGLSFLLKRIKSLVRPLLDRVLKVALDRLPPALQPLARQLAQRVLGTSGEAAEPDREGAPTVAEIATVQQQLDYDVASLVLGDEAEAEVVIAEALSEADRPTGGTPAELEEARERFIDELERGVDPQEALENFLPAVMAVLPIVRTAIGIIGRPKVVNFLARYLAQLIGKYVQEPGAAKALSQAIVDNGLRLLTLEAPTQEAVERLAPEAVVGAVEDTARRVAELDEATLSHPALLEAAVAEAFQEAAAENFPPQMLVPELQEAAGPGTWVAMPVGSRRKRYKKFSRVFDVALTPQLAGGVTTFGGTTLSAFLKDQMGLTGSVPARVHLYQANCGTTLARIAKLERGVPGLGSVAKSAWSQIHPLTTSAAGQLLQQPKLGRDPNGRFLSSRDLIAVGQRFYYLEIAGARPVPPAVDSAGRPQGVQRSSEVNVALDFAKDEFRLFVYLSEADAQAIATRARARDFTAVLLAAKRIYAAGLTTALGGQIGRHVKIHAEALTQEEFLGSALARVTQEVKRELVSRVVEWTGKAVADYFQARAAEFIAATEDPASGATMVVTILSPPGAPFVRKILRGDPSAAADVLRDVKSVFRGDPKVNARTVAGFRFD